MFCSFVQHYSNLGEGLRLVRWPAQHLWLLTENKEAQLKHSPEKTAAIAATQSSGAVPPGQHSWLVFNGSEYHEVTVTVTEYHSIPEVEYEVEKMNRVRWQIVEAAIDQARRAVVSLARCGYHKSRRWAIRFPTPLCKFQ
eukprot:SAG31_NODE_4543_length_3150_cov_1.656506_2_plen_140_part_00